MYLISIKHLESRIYRSLVEVPAFWNVALSATSSLILSPPRDMLQEERSPPQTILSSSLCCCWGFPGKSPSLFMFLILLGQISFPPTNALAIPHFCDSAFWCILVTRRLGLCSFTGPAGAGSHARVFSCCHGNMTVVPFSCCSVVPFSVSPVVLVYMCEGG